MQVLLYVLGAIVLIVLVVRGALSFLPKGDTTKPETKE